MNHVCESLNHTKWECKYHVIFIPAHELRQKSVLADMHNGISQ